MLVSLVMTELMIGYMYVKSSEAIRKNTYDRVSNELSNAELEIELHTVELETAAKSLSLLAQKHLNEPDSILAATHLAVQTLRANTSLAVAFVPNYYPTKGTYYEICSSRITEDSIYTRQIGSVAHDYTQMEWYLNGFVHDSCWWSEPYLDDAGSETKVVSCSCPVNDGNGKVVAVVCVDLSLDYLKDMSENLMRDYKGRYVSIFSNEGDTIVPRLDTIPGEKYYKFEEEIDATGWHIEIILSDKSLYGNLRKTGLILTLLMVAGLLVIGIIIWHTTYTVRKLMRTQEQNQRMESELTIASRIQMEMLPKVFPPFKDRLDLNIYGMVAPAKEVGGDLYDFYIRQDRLFFCVGDVSGKGVPASLVMAMTRTLFRSTSVHTEDPAMIVEKMNRSLCEQNTQNMFITLFLGVLDCKTGELVYCNAGHNAPVLVESQKSKVESLNVLPNLPLGIEPEFVFQAQTAQMQRDDLLFLYTDGLTEAENGAHEQFGEERMMERLAMSDERLASPRELVPQMQASVEAFVDGAPQSDDLTLLAIRYQAPALIMRNDIQQIPTLPEWLEDLGLPMELSMPINLALEEAVTNVMLYAYPGKSGQVLVECTKDLRSEGVKEERSESERLIFTITDSGVPFDPTQKEEVDTTLSAEEREIGGLGIHLVRQIMDEVRYARIDDKNVLTLIKNI